MHLLSELLTAKSLLGQLSIDVKGPLGRKASGTSCQLLGSLPGPFPWLCDLALNPKTATSISSSTTEDIKINCFNVLRTKAKPNLPRTLNCLRLLVAHRCHLGVEGGTTGSFNKPDGFRRG